MHQMQEIAIFCVLFFTYKKKHVTSTFFYTYFLSTFSKSSQKFQTIQKVSDFSYNLDF